MNEPKEAVNRERLLALLGQQRDLYQRLRELSEQQRTLITGDHPELLLNILRERQTLVAALSRLNEELAPYRRDWEATYAALPADLRTKANTLLEDINGLLRLILQTDQEDSALLSARKQTVGGQLGRLSGGRSANAAYAKRAPSGGTTHAADVTG